MKIINEKKGYANIQNQIDLIILTDKLVRDRISKGQVFNPINESDINKINKIVNQLKTDFTEMIKDSINGTVSKEDFVKYLSAFIFLVDFGLIKGEDEFCNMIRQEELKLNKGKEIA